MVGTVGIGGGCGWWVWMVGGLGGGWGGALGGWVIGGDPGWLEMGVSIGYGFVLGRRGGVGQGRRWGEVAWGRREWCGVEGRMWMACRVGYARVNIGAGGWGHGSEAWCSTQEAPTPRHTC